MKIFLPPTFDLNTNNDMLPYFVRKIVVNLVKNISIYIIYLNMSRDHQE